MLPWTLLGRSRRGDVAAKTYAGEAPLRSTYLQRTGATPRGDDHLTWAPIYHVPTTGARYRLSLVRRSRPRR